MAPCDPPAASRATRPPPGSPGRPLALVAALARPGAALAHGGAVPDRPARRRPASCSAGRSTRWSGCRRSSPWCLWWLGVRRVNRLHPGHPVPRLRTLSWVPGGRGAAARAGLRDRALRHDAVLGPHGPAPAADPRRRRSCCSRPGRSRCCCGPRRPRPGGDGSCRSSTPGSSRAISFPVVAWVLFAVVMWASHFSPLFDAALENEWVHRLEHVLFLGVGAAVLVAGRGPGPVAVADARPRPRCCTSASRCPRTRSSGWRSLALGAALRALRDDRPRLGPDAARGPAARRRDHVARAATSRSSR